MGTNGGLWRTMVAPCVVLLTVTCGVPAESKNPGTRVQELPLAYAKGRFDYLEVDPSRHRLLANHTGNGTLDVFALPDGSLLGSIAVGAAQGVAVDSKRPLYFVTVSDRRQLALVDAERLQRMDAIDLPGAPDGLAFDPGSGLVYVAHDNGTDIWVVDPDRKYIVTTIKVPAAPEYAVCDPLAGRIYQNIKSQPSTLVFDTHTRAIAATYSTLPAEKPHGLALEAKRLFCAGGNGKLVVSDADSGSVLHAVDIPAGVDQIAFDHERERIFCASGKEGISVVDVKGDQPRLVATVKTPAGTHTVAVDPETHDAWSAYGTDSSSALVRIHLDDDAAQD